MKDNMNLKLARCKAKMTQLELALSTQMSQTHISHIEKGLAFPTILDAAKIAKALQVDVEGIFPDLSSRPQRKTRKRAGK